MPSELHYLKRDILRVRSESGTGGLLCWFLEVASWAQIAYRVLRWWRLGPLHVAPVRYAMEKLVEAVTHIHLPSGAEIGGGLRIYHGYGLIVNAKTVIGDNVTLYARVVIGERYPGDRCPRLGDGVSVGTGAGVFGPLKVEGNVVIKANAVLSYRTAS